MIGISGKLTRLPRMSVVDMKAIVLEKDKASRQFSAIKGTRQGDGLSASLLNIVIERIVRACSFEGTIIVTAVQVIVYADNIAVTVRNWRSLVEALQKLEVEARKRDFEINQYETT